MSYPPEPPGHGQGGPPGQPPGQPPGSPYGPPYGAYGPGPDPRYGATGLPTTNAKATASMVVGVGSLVLSWCCGLGVVGVVAIVLGIKARSEIKYSRGTQEGDGMALGGIITGAIAVVLGVLVLILIALAFVASSSFDTTTTYGTEL